MAIKVLELHHHGVRVNPERTHEALAFYQDVLGLSPDPGRPGIPGIPGYWMDVGGHAQIHLMGVSGLSPLAKGEGRDPAAPHVALAVRDIQEAKRELDRLGVHFWTLESVTGPEVEQVFLQDPAGNMIELHQSGVCRCQGSKRGQAEGFR